MADSEAHFFAAVAARTLIRPSVRCIIVNDGKVLVQRPADSIPGGGYAFIGGAYEIGDTFEARSRAEIEEETNARLVEWRYLFVVENLFVCAGHQIHGLEHYAEAKIDRTDVVSKEGHLIQEWLPLRTLHTVDLRPHVVRDVLCSGRLYEVRHLVAQEW